MKTIQYVYDSRGNRKALVDPDGGRFTYTYDAVNRISQVQNPQGERTSYSYDPAGRRTVKEMANGTRASFSYDPAGNLTGLYNLKSGGTVISSFDYTYDKVGNRTSVAEADGSRVTWSYDHTYQLTGEHRTGTSPYRDTYTYDPSGNRLLKIHDGARTTYAYDAANQLVYSQDVSGRTTYTFDADGNQQVVHAPTGDRTTYVWDYENRMTSVRLPSGIRNTMAYDADGLRVKLEESTGTKKFVWDDQNYLAETDEANDTQVVYTNEPRRYGRTISQKSASVINYLHFDAVGATRRITDSLETVLATFIYDTFGGSVAAVDMTTCRFRFGGELQYWWDSDLAKYYLRRRSLDSALARFLSQDMAGWGTRRYMARRTRYSYASNRPLFLVDPSGLKDEMACEECNTLLKSPPERIEKLLKCARSFDNCRVVAACECCPKGQRGCTGATEDGRVSIIVCCGIDNPGQTLLHELYHAARYCYWKKKFPDEPLGKTCQNCLQEELLAYLCAGQCKGVRPKECLDKAIASCISEGIEPAMDVQEPADQGAQAEIPNPCKAQKLKGLIKGCTMDELPNTQEALDAIFGWINDIFDPAREGEPGPDHPFCKKFQNEECPDADLPPLIY